MRHFIDDSSFLASYLLISYFCILTLDELVWQIVFLVLFNCEIAVVNCIFIMILTFIMFVFPLCLLFKLILIFDNWSLNILLFTFYLFVEIVQLFFDTGLKSHLSLNLGLILNLFLVLFNLIV